jgi:molybdopterin molybdotransferase
MLSPVEAEAAIRAHATRLPDVAAPLASLAGAVLREPVAASRDQPPFDRVTMDGVAFAMSAYDRGRRAFRVAATQAAGAAPLTLADDETCFEVMTGASLPGGCDCVVPLEKITLRDGVAHIADDAAPARGANVHTRGLDVRSGDPLLSSGARLGPAEVAVIASNGLTEVRIASSPRIAVISTGDELVEPGQAPADWQIYRSNAYAVVSALARRGFHDVAHDHLPDDLGVLRTRLAVHLERCDVLILSGGVSMGRYDYVPQALGELGVKVVFHKVSQRPGKPLWFGVGAGGKTVYALPGNPVSTLVCLTRYVFPGLDAALGAAPTAAEFVTLLEDVEVKPSLTLFMPVRLSRDAARSGAMLRPTRGSGDFTSLVGTDGFVELPPGPCLIEAGARAPLYRW